MNTHSNSLLNLKGVGPRVAEKLQRLDIHNQNDLLFHLPLRYQDRSHIYPIGSLRAGAECQIQGEVQLSEIKYGRGRMLLTRLADGTGFITLRFFHFSNAQKNQLKRGARLLCFGEVRRGKVGFEMAHPEYQFLKENEEIVLDENLSPIYPTTEGVHQLTLRNVMSQVIEKLKNNELQLADLIPAEILAKNHWPTLKKSLLYIHNPPVDAQLEELSEGKHLTQQSLIIEELLAHHLSMRQLRVAMHKEKAPVLNNGEGLTDKFLSALPFELTNAQQKVVQDINFDLEKSSPMQRLVQGDVGSGKTVVAALAMLKAVESGYQAAIMAPTELLAEQHFQNFKTWLVPLGINVVWLSGKLKVAAKREALEQINSAKGQVVVGTHALFQGGVEFNKLGLIIVDEQHRFGVHQRLALREKGNHNDGYPHQLIMTATPIPRTLAMTAYADLDCSVIDELPPGRIPVETVVIPESKRDAIVQRVEQACLEGRQIYWVCTLIEESETLQAQAAEDTANLLAEALTGVRVALVHGRMKAEQKEKVMMAFKAGEVDLLVATTVIEVGVDVPNASLMIIENAERLGLSQLHQLRGRVGRGSQESACVLMYHGTLSDNARQRLAIMRETNDGFEIARKDLELRGPGEVLGTKQTGLMQMRIADLQRDQELIPQVAEMADQIFLNYPDCVEPLINRWIGQAKKYAAV
ncbi:MAG: ATP-dependent DNA helicase RecG [Gammaproteobacteria bacterium]|nr:MAG: ATP-dependent DNA helicase RecG [Gammaproteobacteria bacterium]